MPTDKEKKPFTEAEKTEHVKKIQEEIEKQRKKVKKGDNFVAPTEEQLREKLGRVNSPMLTWQGWGTSTPPGGTFTYSVGAYNPDPTWRGNLICYFFVGPGNAIADLSSFMLNADQRFPRLGQTPPYGFSLNPSEMKTISFPVKVPADALPGVYLGNSVLFMFNFNDVGTYYDRATFPFQVA
ncbi:MAG TPA: hypothetical protein VJ866_19485 [Pyrinomonadaceae bacterium]|nr:hypothetical protein [Pyrinomonadaceae bacterium]